MYALLTFFRHANVKAFLQSTGLTPVPCHFVYDTHFVSVARVHHVFLDTPPKETLTGEKWRQVVKYKSKVTHYCEPVC